MNCTCQPQNVPAIHDFQVSDFVTTRNNHSANEPTLSIRDVSQAPRPSLE